MNKKSFYDKPEMVIIKTDEKDFIATSGDGNPTKISKPLGGLSIALWDND